MHLHPVSLYLLPHQPQLCSIHSSTSLSPHLHPTGPQPDKHPAPLPHVFQGHGKSVLACHLHEVVTVEDLGGNEDLGSQEEGGALAVDELQV